VASLSQGRTAAAQCGLFTHKSVPVIFEPPCIYKIIYILYSKFPLVIKSDNDANILDSFFSGLTRTFQTSLYCFSTIFPHSCCHI